MNRLEFLGRDKVYGANGITGQKPATSSSPSAGPSPSSPPTDAETIHSKAVERHRGKTTKQKNLDARKRNRAEVMGVLAGMLRLGAADVATLSQIFDQRFPDGSVTLPEFSSVFGELYGYRVPNAAEYSANVFKAFDIEDTGAIEYEEYLTFMAVAIQVGCIDAPDLRCRCSGGRKEAMHFFL